LGEKMQPSISEHVSAVTDEISDIAADYWIGEFMPETANSAVVGDNIAELGGVSPIEEEGTIDLLTGPSHKNTMKKTESPAPLILSGDEEPVSPGSTRSRHQQPKFIMLAVHGNTDPAQQMKNTIYDVVGAALHKCLQLVEYEMSKTVVVLRNGRL
jgi:hypothetical protein